MYPEKKNNNTTESERNFESSLLQSVDEKAKNKRERSINKK
jgi:hypothetical protein